jgi:hypothetical protein
MFAAWRDEHEEKLKAEESIKNLPARDWNVLWKELGRKFAELPSHLHASFQQGGFGFHGEHIGVIWNISGDDKYKEALILCKSAGKFLFLSPKLSALMPSDLNSISDETDRWLFFLKRRQQLQLDPHPGISTYNGETQTVLTGMIYDIGRVSARICEECAGEEL